MQLNAKALAATNEKKPTTFQTIAENLVHFHANEPDLGILGTSGTIDKDVIGRMICDVIYNGYVSIRQHMMDLADPLSCVSRSIAVLKECYGNE